MGFVTTVASLLFGSTIALQLQSHGLFDRYFGAAAAASVPVSPAVAAELWPWTSAFAMGAIMLSQMTGRLKRVGRLFRVFLSSIATLSCMLYLWPSPKEERLVTTQLLMMVYVSLQVIGCLRILADPHSLMADGAISTFTPPHFFLGWLILVWRVPSTVPIVLGEALMLGVMWVSVYAHFCADSNRDSFLNPAPSSLKVAGIVGAIVGGPVYHIVSSVCHNIFFAPHSRGFATFRAMIVTPDPHFTFGQVLTSLFWVWYFGLCFGLLIIAVVVRKVTRRSQKRTGSKKTDAVTESDKVANGALEFTARG